ncbi:MAG: hypothetical protein MASP_00119 [Candidatus Methanolliviera sp. GoM_asphalt]|nr:MAG: hypothetical protein MASP_00119 [Candidatus Methanolliviera sp. GoM_asphalt]
MKQVIKFFTVSCLMLLLLSVGSATTLIDDKSNILGEESSFGPGEPVSMRVVLADISGYERIEISTSFEDPHWDIDYIIGYGKGSRGNLSSNRSSISLPMLPYRSVTVNLTAKTPAMDRDGRLALISIKNEETDTIIMRKCFDVYGKFSFLQKIDDKKEEINDLNSAIIGYEREGISVSDLKETINDAFILIETANRNFRIDGDYKSAIYNFKDAEGLIQKAEDTLEKKEIEKKNMEDAKKTRNIIYLVVAIAIILIVVIILMRRGGKKVVDTRAKL